MKFLVYAAHNETSIRDSLGTADYSYYFVMKRYLPLLEPLGAVVVLAEPPTDERIAGHVGQDQCLLLSFTPPDKVARVSLCPVVVVFAWEFSTIPYEEFTRASDNWVAGLQLLGRALTHSSYAVAVVRRQLGEDFDIESIPAPLWDSCEGVRTARRAREPGGLAAIELACRAIDSACYELSNTAVWPKHIESDFKTRPFGQEWQGQPLEFDFAAGGPLPSLIGFNKPEAWGIWSKPGYPWILLEHLIAGHIELSVTVQGYAQNVGARLRIQCGTGAADLLLSEEFSTHTFCLHLEHATNVVAFVGVIDKAVGMVDPRDIGFGLTRLSIRKIDDPLREPAGFTLDMLDESVALQGFHEAEHFGRWVAHPVCTIALPHAIRGDISLRLKIPYPSHNEGHSLQVYLGEAKQDLTLYAGVTDYELEFPDNSATDYIQLAGLRTGSTGNDSDARVIGLGLSQIDISCKTPETLPTPDSDNAVQSPPDRPVECVLYTTILNPMDDRKNWEDLITAFVYAFRENPGAALLIKITHHDFDSFFEDIFTFFTELYPFRCRLVFIHGFLPEEEFARLLEHSHFIVNASSGEGQCLPLMEFMSAGVPAIAPLNTAMLDYIDTDNAFVVACSAEPTCWPQDPRYVYRAECQRINWASLRDAFIASEHSWRDSRARYREMSDAAIASLQRFCSLAVAREKLEKFVARALPQKDGR